MIDPKDIESLRWLVSSSASTNHTVQELVEAAEKLLRKDSFRSGGDPVHPSWWDAINRVKDELVLEAVEKEFLND